MRILFIQLSFFFVITLIIYVLKVPIAYSTFYAEDGALFLQEAKTLQFPLDFIQPAAGYLVLVSRIIGRVVSLFPLEVLPLVNFMVVCLFIAIFCVVTWSNINNLIRNIYLKFFCTLSLLLIPILNFELLASSSSLHFLLLFPTALIFLKVREDESITYGEIFIVALGLLSDPTAILLVLLLVKSGTMANWSLISKKIKSFYLLIFCCIAVQCTYALQSITTQSRSFGNTSSFLKTCYLYLDRVVGSTLVPNWGFVSSDDVSAGVLTPKILLRGTVALVILSTIVYLLFLSIRRAREENLETPKPIINAIALLSISIMHWVCLGYLFNPEPRYAIFPGLCLVVVALIIVDSLPLYQSKKSFLFSNVITRTNSMILCLLALTWVFSFNPSSLRTEGPTWANELILAREACKSGEQEHVNLKIVPKNWTVQLNCTEVNRG